MSHEPYTIAEFDSRQQASRIAHEKQSELKRIAIRELDEATHVKDASDLAQANALRSKVAAQKIYSQALRDANTQTSQLIELRDVARSEAAELFRRAGYARNSLMYEISDKIYAKAKQLRETADDYEFQREELMIAKREASANQQEAAREYTYLLGVYSEVVADYQRAVEKLEATQEICVAKERMHQVAQAAYRQAVLVRARMPVEYHSSAIIRMDREGEISLYYGGAVKPDGPGHGHITLSPTEDVIYDRPPNSSHGAHNYTVVGASTEV